MMLCESAEGKKSVSSLTYLWLYYKPNELLMTSEVMDLRREPTIDIFQNKYNSQLHYKYLVLHQKISSVTQFLLKKLFLQETEIITKCHNLSKCKEWLTIQCPCPIDSSTTELLHLRLREHHRRKNRKIVNARVPRWFLWQNVYYICQGAVYTCDILTIWLIPKKKKKTTENVQVWVEKIPQH